MVVLIKASESYKIWNINFTDKPLYIFKQPALGNYCIFIICLFMYFKYFPSILLIYIIFEDTNVKQR